MIRAASAEVSVAPIPRILKGLAEDAVAADHRDARNAGEHLAQCRRLLVVDVPSDR
jgi:hypothetical protein